LDESIKLSKNIARCAYWATGRTYQKARPFSSTNSEESGQLSGRTWLVARLRFQNDVFPPRGEPILRASQKRLAKFEAAFAMFAAYYNYCWQTRQPGTSGKKRPTAARMAKLTGHVWSFDELFAAVLSGG
jgi:hypothetical protein